MLKMRNYIFISCFLLAGNFLFAQQDFVIGKKYSLQSFILNEKREFWVYLPRDYNNPEFPLAKYPVIYLVDGEMFFHSYTGIVEALSRGPYQSMPQAIVVGIVNTDRTRDLTPTAATRAAYYDDKTPLYKNSGGNENFIRFLEKELRPYIDNAYRTSGYNIFNGHSFGGLAAVNILLHHTSLFNAYIIIDPSLWWDDTIMLKQADSILSAKDFKHTNIYLAKAYKEIIPQDTATDHQRSIDAFKDLLEAKQPKNLRWNFTFYEKEDHGTIIMPAVYDGLRFIFNNHWVHVKKAVDDPEIVMQQFDALSKQSGFAFKPSEGWLEWMGNYCRSIHRMESAIIFYKLAVELYPQSENAKHILNKAVIKKK